MSRKAWNKEVIEQVDWDYLINQLANGMNVIVVGKNGVGKSVLSNSLYRAMTCKKFKMNLLNKVNQLDDILEIYHEKVVNGLDLLFIDHKECVDNYDAIVSLCNNKEATLLINDSTNKYLIEFNDLDYILVKLDVVNGTYYYEIEDK